MRSYHPNRFMLTNRLLGQQTGNAGKWQTSHQQTKMALQKDANVQPGDTGIWVTCARHQESKAAREISVLFSEYAEKIYGIKGVHETAADDEDEDDIEAAIKKEVAALTSKKESTGASEGENQHIMTPMKMNVDCLLFVKTKSPIQPVEMVRRICEDAKSGARSGQMRCRYVNRLTPVTVQGKATEQGMVEVAKAVLDPFFDLSGKKESAGASEPEAEKEEPKEDVEKQAEESESGSTECKPFTFAIRPTIRNHSKLTRDVVINTIAGLVNSDKHKVNLGAPDKVILVDVYQTVCGMSVVDGDWEGLKRFNLTELYGQAAKGGEHPAAEK